MLTAVEHSAGKAYVFVAVFMKCVKRSVLSRISYYYHRNFIMCLCWQPKCSCAQ